MLILLQGIHKEIPYIEEKREESFTDDLYREFVSFRRNMINLINKWVRST